MDVHEVVRLKRAGRNNSEISRLLGCDRKTTQKYVKWAGHNGLLDTDRALPSADAVQTLLDETKPQQRPPQQTSTLEKYTQEVQRLRGFGMEIAAIKTRLEENHRRDFSYEALRRLVKRIDPLVPDAVVRVEVEPGSEAQVDFGYAGLTLDDSAARRKTWVFVMTLSWSRHQYCQLVYNQTVETWLECHRRAFEFFGAVPGRIVLDNLKAAITNACVDDPAVQRAYREFATHYGFLIDPNPPRRPNLKGKVEKGGVHYVKRNFLAGREPEPTVELNRKLLSWCIEVAGERVHGTTKERPLVRFEQVEREAMLPLPTDPYDMAIWKAVKLHRDCHVSFDRSFYSAPYRLVGQTLWARGGTRTVKVYTSNYELVATHDRATQPGQRMTNPEHLPPEKLPGLALSRDNCRLQAQEIGPATTEIVNTLLDDRPIHRLRTAGRLIALAKAHSPERVERACARALAYGDGEYATVKRILLKGLDEEPADATPRTLPGRPVFTFARKASEYAVALLGGSS
jgi:transposase